MNKHMTVNYPFPRNSPEHKWYAFGRYYAMFPPSFPYEAIDGLTEPDDMVLDPFCGRGNSLFCAMAQDRGATGIDINPLAYLYSAVRCNIVVDKDDVLERLRDVSRAVMPQDRVGGGAFETMAWSPDVRGFLRAARRELDWRCDDTDRVLMGFVALHGQDKPSKLGLSNKLPPTIACSPDYAVRWWNDHAMTKPPSTDPVESLTDKICRRFQFGVPGFKAGEAWEGDAREVLAALQPLNASLLITSPPYIDVTDYWNDHWIRLWLLGYLFRKDWARAAKFLGKVDYKNMLCEVFTAAKRHLSDDATVLVRSDLRKRTSEVCRDVLQNVFPNHKMYMYSSEAPGTGESVHHGHGGTRAKEVDFLLAGNDRAESWAKDRGFREVTAWSSGV